jgi:hypothetical protein
MPQSKIRARVALKYCGSCNPFIDPSRLGGHLKEVAAGYGFELVSPDAPHPDILVIISGCNRACVIKPELLELAPKRLIVAGETVNGRPVPEKDLPAALEKELLRLLPAATV